MIKAFGLPLLVFAVNIALAVVTGLWIYGIAAFVIGVLMALKFRHFVRERAGAGPSGPM